MRPTSLIATDTLAAHLDDPAWAIIDCRFDLTQPERGRAAYLQGHIPGAIYVHLDEDLAAPHIPGQTGRHPLPPAERFAETLSAWGIDADVQVVVYDDAAGGFAGRLWWMLRWMGHTQVALLDGDWRAWVGEGHPVRAGVESRAPRAFVGEPDSSLVADASEIRRRLNDPSLRLLDARTLERYMGQNELIDPIAGHIPGARSAPTAGNLESTGAWKPDEVLRSRYEALLDGLPAEQCVVYCGSGVSATQLLIAMEQAGLPGARLYPGSWSDWITDAAHPIATGADESSAPVTSAAPG